MTDNDSGPHESRGSRHGSIDIDARLRAIEKQRRIILEATDDERIERCMRMVGCDLVATQRIDFQRASELSGNSEATHQRLLTGGEGGEQERGRELETLPAKRGYTIVHDPDEEDAWLQIPEDLLVEVGGDE